MNMAAAFSENSASREPQRHSISSRSPSPPPVCLCLVYRELQTQSFIAHLLKVVLLCEDVHELLKCDVGRVRVWALPRQDGVTLEVEAAEEGVQRAWG